MNNREPDPRQTFEDVSRDVFEGARKASGGIVIEGTNDPPNDPPEGMARPLYCVRRGRWVDAARYSGVLYLPPLTEADQDYSHWDQGHRDK